MSHVTLWPDTPRETRIQAVAYRLGMPVYIRYGLWESRSYNHATGERESGVSVYRGRVAGCVVSAHPDEDISDELDGQGRLVFPVTGEEHWESGSDGEPLLRRVRLVTGIGLDTHLKR